VRHDAQVTEPDIFVAYAGSDSLRADAVRNASELIARRLGLSVLTWEQMQSTGNLLIQQIQEKIRASKVVIAEISSLNANVLYEVGYAISQNKHIWLLVDYTDETVRHNWKTLGLLSGIGYSDYQGDSERLYSLFSAEYPSLLTRQTAWEEMTNSLSAVSADPRTLFYLPTSLRGDGPRSVERTLMKRKSLTVLSADEDERGYAPISYYSELITKSTAALIYLLAPSRTRARMHNARASLISGLASGLDRPVLMVAEHPFDAPFDYQDLLYVFSSARAASSHVDHWLELLPQSLSARPIGLQLALGLPQRFGEYVAEYESQDLANYLVETAEYRRVTSSGSAIFVGRKGTGKTATMLRAAEQLADDKRNLVAVIKPSGYEFESLVSVLEQVPQRDTVDYLLDGLWQYLLHCEIGCAALREAEARPAGIASGSALDRLRSYLELHDIGTDLDFSVRLERVLDELSASELDLPQSVELARASLNKKLHASMIMELRKLIGEALAERERVAVLVDNLDKAWDRGANYERLSRVIFGLLSAIGRVSADYSRDNRWRKRVNVTLSVFLRADIFSMVIRYAREPDKIEKLHIRWDNETLLARVIEDRFRATREDQHSGDVWSMVFTPVVRGMEAKSYLLWRTLPRPRDLINLCNGAVMLAVNNGHAVVQERDIVGAEEEYSRFAFEALEVESDPEAGLGDLLFEFAGANATLSESEVREFLRSSGSSTTDAMLGTLLRSSFLGMETSDGNFEFFSDEAAQRRNTILAQRLTTTRLGRPARYRIHPAFRPFLSISDDDLSVDT